MRGYERRVNADFIKEAVDPYDFYLREQDLHRYGYRSGAWRIAGTCPFHDDRKPGSFKVNTETGSFKCWSCGAAGGDIIAFLQQRDHLDFVKALKKLIDEWEVRSC